MRYFLSDELIAEIRRNPTPRHYQKANAIDWSASYFSKAVNRAIKVDPDDPAVILLGKMHGIPPERCTTRRTSK